MASNVLWFNEKTAEPARGLTFPAPLEVRFVGSEEEALRLRDWAEVLVSGDPGEQLLDGARLERVVVPWAGVGTKLRERALARPHLRVHNSHYNGPMVAQHAVALLLACAGRIVAADRAMRLGDWGRDDEAEHLGVQLTGKVALLLGFGSIGRALVAPLRGLGMEVRAYRRNPDPADEVPTYGPDRLHEALAEADAVIVSLPAAPATVGLLGAEQLALLKPTAVLVNVGRGTVVDEEALYSTLREERILGAGIDVWYRYPKDDPGAERTFPSLFPFQELDNVVMSPHRGNDVLGWREAAARDVALTLEAVAAGEERNLVDLESGYWRGSRSPR